MQLIYTSAARLVDAGKTGFGAVSRSEGMGESLQRALERMNTFSRGTEHDNKRIIYCYRTLQIGSAKYHVISQLRDAGSDYTGRTNHIGHHIVFSELDVQTHAIPNNITPAGAILDIIQQKKWCDQWEGNPKKIAAHEELQLQDITSDASQMWLMKTGYQENAYQLITGTAVAPSIIITPDDWQTTELLTLLAESAQLMPDKGWGKSFTTYWEEGESASDFSFICSSLQRSQNHNIQDLRRARLNLTQTLPPFILPEKPEVIIPKPSAIPLPSIRQTPRPNTPERHIYNSPPPPIHTLARAKKKQSPLQPYLIIGTLSLLLLGGGAYYFLSTPPTKKTKENTIKPIIQLPNEKDLKNQVIKNLSSLFNAKDSKEFQARLNLLQTNDMPSLNTLINNAPYQGELKDIHLKLETIAPVLQNKCSTPENINNTILSELITLADFCKLPYPKHVALKLYVLWSFPSNKDVPLTNNITWSQWHTLHETHNDTNSPTSAIGTLQDILKGKSVLDTAEEAEKKAYIFFGGSITETKKAKPAITEKPKESEAKPTIKVTKTKQNGLDLCSPFSSPLSTTTIDQLNKLAQEDTRCKVNIILNGEAQKKQENVCIKKTDQGFIVSTVIREKSVHNDGEFKDLVSISPKSITTIPQKQVECIEITLSFGGNDQNSLQLIALDPQKEITLKPQNQKANKQNKFDHIKIKQTKRDGKYPEDIALDFPMAQEAFKQDQQWIYDASSIIPKSSLKSDLNLSQKWNNLQKIETVKTALHQNQFEQYLKDLAPYYATLVTQKEILELITLGVKKSDDKEQLLIKQRKTAFQQLAPAPSDKKDAPKPKPEYTELIEQLTPIHNITMERTKEQKRKDERAAKSKKGDVAQDNMAEFVELDKDQKLEAKKIIDEWLRNKLSDIITPKLKPITLKISNISLDNNIIHYTMEETQ